jgi:hypothetical protein
MPQLPLCAFTAGYGLNFTFYLYVTLLKQDGRAYSTLEGRNVKL